MHGLVQSVYELPSNLTCFPSLSWSLPLKMWTIGDYQDPPGVHEIKNYFLITWNH